MTEPTLTAQDVREVTFATTRLRAGYDMHEVDAFLSRVERTIAELTSALGAAHDQQMIQRAQLDRLQERCNEGGAAATQPIPVGLDPLVREIRERMRKTLTEQLALLDQFAESGRSSDRESQR